MSRMAKIIVINSIATLIVLAAFIMFKSVLWIAGAFFVAFLWQDLMRQYWLDKGDEKLKWIMINTTTSIIILSAAVSKSILLVVIAAILALAFHHLSKKYWINSTQKVT
ncbi:hypothetical protein NSQ26_00420 [Bacillus sp. FSL W7-1360]